MPPLPPPSDAFALSILEKVERLLATGRFTTTYKFALLVALTNIAVERGDDSGDPLEVDLDEVARQYLLLYWNQARPHPRIGAVLRQWTDARKPSQIVAMLRDAAAESPLGHLRLRAHRGRDSLVSRTRQTLAKDVLYRLQTFATGTGRERSGDPFLYDHPPTAAECARLRSIRLKPGVAASLRRLRGVIVAVVQARWALWVRERNESLGPDRDLESFLFGVRRGPVAAYATRLYELQEGRCFYTGSRLGEPRRGEVDHFIPWSRYPWDSPFNLVLASRSANSAKRDRLAPPSDRDRWLDRNDAHEATLVAPPPRGLGAPPDDRLTAKAVAKWIYRRDAVA